MSIKWNSKILLAKVEDTYGVDSSPTAALNGILAIEVSLDPMAGNDVSRELETPYLGAQGSVPVDVHSSITFKVELATSGVAGTAPAWGPLMRGCGVAQTIDAGTSVTYNPVSDDHESLSIYFQIGATQYVMRGARGDCTVELNASAIPYLKFSFTGLFEQPTEQARALPTLSAFKKPLAVSKSNTPVFTLDNQTMLMRSFMLALGCQVEPRFLVGTEDILIVDRTDNIETKVEAVPLTGFDPYAAALNQSVLVIQLQHGTAAGSIVTLDVPTAQMQRPQGLENAQNIAEWPLRLIPVPTNGNDQWTLTLT